MYNICMHKLVLMLPIRYVYIYRERERWRERKICTYVFVYHSSSLANGYNLYIIAHSKTFCQCPQTQPLTRLMIGM